MLAADFHLAAHFTAGELTRDGGQLGAFLPDVTPAVETNLFHTARGLESIREALGVPLRVASGFRPPAKNAAVGGVSSSSHLDGLAADVLPVGMSQYAAYVRLQAAQLTPWDQIIYYPVQGHIHVGYGVQLRREVRIALSSDPGGAPLLSGGLVERLGGYVESLADAGKDSIGWLALIVLAIGAVLLFRKSKG